MVDISRGWSEPAKVVLNPTAFGRIRRQISHRVDDIVGVAEFVRASFRGDGCPTERNCSMCVSTVLPLVRSEEPVKIPHLPS